MLSLLLLISYHCVSSRFIWQSSFNNPPTNNNDDNIFDNLLNNFNLDISFHPNSNQYPSMFQNPPNQHFYGNYNDMYDNMGLFDESPSSMFSSWPSFFSQPQTPSAITNKPLYLMVQSSPTIRSKPKSSTYTLTKTNKVNGDTWRYSVNNNGPNQQISESWSNHRMYLCHNAECTNSNGIEMKNVLDSEDIDDLGYKYMHLIPTGTMEPMDTDFEDDENDYYDSYFPLDFGGIINNLWNKASKAYTDFVNILDYDSDNYDYIDDIDDDFEDDSNDSSHFGFGLDDIFGSFANLWSDDNDSDYFDYDGRYNYDMDELNGLDIEDNNEDLEDEDKDEEVLQEEEDNDADSEYVYNEDNDEFILAKDNVFASGGNNEQILANEDEAASIASEEKHDLVIVEMTVIIFFVMTCGVLYGGYKYLLERRAKAREFEYYLGSSSPL